MINIDQMHIAHEIQWSIKKEKIKTILFNAFIATLITTLFVLTSIIANLI